MYHDYVRGKRPAGRYWISSQKVAELCESGKAAFHPTYKENVQPIQEKIDAVAKNIIYGATKVNYTPEALEQLKEIEEAGSFKCLYCETPYTTPS